MLAAASALAVVVAGCGSSATKTVTVTAAPSKPGDTLASVRSCLRGAGSEIIGAKEIGTQAEALYVSLPEGSQVAITFAESPALARVIAPRLAASGQYIVGTVEGKPDIVVAELGQAISSDPQTLDNCLGRVKLPRSPTTSTTSGTSTASAKPHRPISAETEITNTVITYLRALANGDGSLACDQLTTDEATAVENYFAQQIPQLDTSDCVDALTTVAGSLGGSGAAALRSARVSSVVVHGDSATAVIAGGDHPAQLTQIGGHWYISGGLTSG